MSEHDVHWVGRKPAVVDAEAAAVARQEYADVIVAACEAEDCKVSRYVAAKGPYGSWLVELSINDCEQRLIWNGQSGELCLQAKRPPSFWDPVRGISPQGRDLETLAAAASQLLRDTKTGTA